MGVHESQSLLWERMVALSEPFQHYLLPKLRDFFPGQIAASVTPEMLYGAVNVVKNPSLIRVESDELTYTVWFTTPPRMISALLPLPAMIVVERWLPTDAHHP